MPVCHLIFCHHLLTISDMQIVSVENSRESGILGFPGMTLQELVWWCCGHYTLPHYNWSVCYMKGSLSMNMHNLKWSRDFDCKFSFNFLFIFEDMLDSTIVIVYVSLIFFQQGNIGQGLSIARNGLPYKNKRNIETHVLGEHTGTWTFFWCCWDSRFHWMHHTCNGYCMVFDG